MPNPKRRHSSARRDKRRANWLAKLTVPTLVKCNKPGGCKGMHMPHHVCPTCGTYDGRVVLNREHAIEA